MRNAFHDPDTDAVALLSRYLDGKRIDRIYTPLAHRGKGAARKLLREVLKAADAEGITLRLIVCADYYRGEPGLDNKQLEAFYMSEGFTRDDNAVFHLTRRPHNVSTN